MSAGTAPGPPYIALPGGAGGLAPSNMANANNEKKTNSPPPPILKENKMRFSDENKRKLSCVMESMTAEKISALKTSFQNKSALGKNLIPGGSGAQDEATKQEKSYAQKVAECVSGLVSSKNGTLIGPSKGDVIGGFTLGLILMAQSVAHAGLCGLSGADLIHGPYSCILPPLIYACLGSSRHGSVGTGSLVALLTGQFIKNAEINNHPIAAQVVCMTTIVGIVLILMRLLQLQALVKFLSRAALVGFVNASAILIIESQFRAVIGLRKDPNQPQGFPGKVFDLVKQLINLDFVNWQIGALGLAQLLLLFAAKKISKSKWMKDAAEQKKGWVPFLKFIFKMKDIVAVCFAFAVSYVVTENYPAVDLNNVGALQSGLPAMIFPPSPIAVKIAPPVVLPSDTTPPSRPVDPCDPSNTPDTVLFYFGSENADGHTSCVRVSGLWQQLLPGGAVVAFIAFLSSFAGAKKFALQDGTYQVDASKELNALGTANLLGSFFGAIPVQVGLSRTAIGYEAGVQSQWGGNVVVAVMVIFLSLLFTPIFHYVPQSTLAAIIISGASGLFDFQIVRYLYNMEPELYKKRGFWINIVAFVGTLLVGVAQGILVPGFLSVFLLIKDATKLRVREMGKLPQSKSWRTKDTWKTARSVPDILALRLEGNLTFSNADALFDEITKHVEGNGGLEGDAIKALVLDMGNVAICDFSALAVLEEMAAAWRRKKKFLIIVATRDNIRERLERLLMPLIPNPSLLLNTDDGVTLAKFLITGEAATRPSSPVRKSSKDQSQQGSLQKVVIEYDEKTSVGSASIPPSLKSFVWAKFNADELDEMHSELHSRYDAVAHRSSSRDNGPSSTSRDTGPLNQPLLSTNDRSQSADSPQRGNAPFYQPTQRLSGASVGSDASRSPGQERWTKLGTSTFFQSRKLNVLESTRLNREFSEVALTPIAATASNPANPSRDNLLQ
ncbi:unnamed protein product [Amoebophrya sp. A120]|nr:unnamed protein product [Amoebophrya sp. A120]|eukprot:GSA120T00016977001.1